MKKDLPEIIDDKEKREILISFLHDVFSNFVKEYRYAISMNDLADRIISILK